MNKPCPVCGKQHGETIEITGVDKATHYETIQCFYQRLELKDALLREFAEADPVYNIDCPYCDYNPGADEHTDDCLWLRARKLMGLTE